VYVVRMTVGDPDGGVVRRRSGKMTFMK
jgi:hypothetical protein